MPEINWAQRQRDIENNPTLAQCYGTGRIHYAYGWSKTPYGVWTDEQKAEYARGYDDAKAEASKLKERQIR